ncbi:ABC transporter ATP-binding protein [Marinobacter sp. C2H3]|uniref:ABC transporter ATP-binding protein n=1 Tax=Marinobacter sp. C2H3 TaxID=3119003 RepID=UPI00300ED975
MTALIRLQGIARRYGRGDTLVRALDDVSLGIDEGEFVAIMGPSGSGKSTCMNLLGCLDTPTDGQYWFRDVDVGQLTADELALLRRHFLGFVFQSFNLLPRVSALQNVELPLVYQGVAPAERRRRALAALATVGLEGRAGAAPSELSGGQQQRVAIARALVSEPPVLLADEPTGNLDTVMSTDIMNRLVQLRTERQLTIIMVTHEPDIARYADRVLLFRDGRLVGDGPPDQVMG